MHHGALPLSELPLSARDQAYCKRAGLRSAAQILCTPTAQLNKTLSQFIDEDGALRIYRAAVERQAPKVQSLLDLVGGNAGTDRAVGANDDQLFLRDETFLSTGDAAMDRSIGGGLRAGALTEIVGESCIGKTQTALQAAVFTALAFDEDADHLHGSDSGVASQSIKTDPSADIHDALQGQGIRRPDKRKSVIIITCDGEGEIGMLLRRMEGMCDALVEDRWIQLQQRRLGANTQERTAGSKRRRRGTFATTETDRMDLCDVQRIARQQLLANIHVAAMRHYPMLHHALEYDMPSLVEKHKAGLLIVDDLTGIINEAAGQRAARTAEQMVERSRICAELSDTFKSLAARSVAVVAINHVFDVLDRHKDIFRAVVEERLDRMLEERGLDQTRPPQGLLVHGKSQQVQTQRLAAIHATPPGQDSHLSRMFQELDFSGISAHIHRDALILASERLQAGATRAQVVDGLMYGLRSASLGLVWVNSVNVRILLVRSPRNVVLPSKQHRKRLGKAKLRPSHPFGVRRAVNIKNPFAPAGDVDQHGIDFIITPDGVRTLQTLQIEPAHDAAGADVPPAETLLEEPHRLQDDDLWQGLDHDGFDNEEEMRRLIETGEEERTDCT